MVRHRTTAKGHEHLEKGDINFLADTIKYALLTSAYTPNYETDEFFSVIDADEVVGAGYTAGGVTLAGKTIVNVDDSGVTARADSTGYEIGDIVRPLSADGHIYYAVVAGTSGASNPSWVTTHGRETVDGTVVWTQRGDSYLKYDADNVAWGPGFTGSPRYSVVYRSGTAGVDDYILSIGDFEVTIPVNDGDFSVEFHTTGLHRSFRVA